MDTRAIGDKGRVGCGIHASETRHAKRGNNFPSSGLILNIHMPSVLIGPKSSAQTRGGSFRSLEAKNSHKRRADNGDLHCRVK